MIYLLCIFISSSKLCFFTYLCSCHSIICAPVLWRPCRNFF